MKKLFQGLLFLIIATFSAWQIAACSIGDLNLGGAAGAQETMIAAELSATPQVSPTGTFDIAFYKQPTMNGGFITTSQTAYSSIGKGIYEITLPKKMRLRDSKSAQFIIALDPKKVSKSQTIPYSQRNQDPLQIIQGDIDIWPCIRAELKSSETFSIVSNGNSDKTISPSSPVAKWNWQITPNKNGEQTLTLSVLILSNSVDTIQLTQMPLKIFVEELSTPTPTSMP